MVKRGENFGKVSSEGNRTNWGGICDLLAHYLLHLQHALHRQDLLSG